MALHLPPEKLVSALMKHVTLAFDNADPNVRRAAFICLAVASEGCGDNLKTKQLDKLLPRVYAGMTDADAEVGSDIYTTLFIFTTCPFVLLILIINDLLYILRHNTFIFNMWDVGRLYLSNFCLLLLFKFLSPVLELKNL